MGEDKAFARYASEFTGTFVLVATVCGNVLSNQNYWGGISIACALAVMVFALGKSSGAHFNPAVTIALLAADKFPLREVPYYMAAQFSGGLLAAILGMELYLGDDVIRVGPVGDSVWWHAGFCEFLYTMVLAFVVLNVAASDAHAGRSQFYGIAIGFVIAAGAYGAGSVSGGCFNPAVALGLEIGSSIHAAEAPTWYFGMYIVIELLAGLAAAVIYRIVRSTEYNREPLENRTPPLIGKLLAEFLGTFVLVLTVSLNVLTGSPAAAFSIAASLMVMIFALGTVSGAHLNPAVTVAVLLAGRNKITQVEAVYYMGVQCLAGIIAGRLSWLFTGLTLFESLKPASSGWTQALVAEIFYTMVLAFVVLSVATVKNPLSEYFGFSIGMCVTVGGCAIGSISGGSLNPAVSMGIAFSSAGSNIWEFIPYGLVELLAGGLAVGLFKLTQPSEYAEDASNRLEEESAEAAAEEGFEKHVGPDDIHLQEKHAQDFGRPTALGRATAGASKAPAPLKGPARSTPRCGCLPGLA